MLDIFYYSLSHNTLQSRSKLLSFVSERAFLAAEVFSDFFSFDFYQVFTSAVFFPQIFVSTFVRNDLSTGFKYERVRVYDNIK